ncbi:PqqD family protein [Nocardioides plantarum]|uniref:PqqD family protein n=1 Tax=Nocardioides plantarum TaxID=29299 RepID=A0ABV5K8B3_9ACTN|nr:PqqD family protein [Nocardioides plantarum]
MLEGSAAVVWRLLAGGQSTEALVEAVAEAYVVSPADVEDDVHRFLESAVQLGAVSRGEGA